MVGKVLRAICRNDLEHIAHEEPRLRLRFYPAAKWSVYGIGLDRGIEEVNIDTRSISSVHPAVPDLDRSRSRTRSVDQDDFQSALRKETAGFVKPASV